LKRLENVAENSRTTRSVTMTFFFTAKSTFQKGKPRRIQTGAIRAAARKTSMRGVT
jgi:hypothetical protein